MDSILVEQTPQVFVLHYYGEVIGYVLDTPEEVYTVVDNGQQIIRAKTLEQFQDVFLDRIGCQMSRPEATA